MSNDLLTSRGHRLDQAEYDAIVASIAAGGRQHGLPHPDVFRRTFGTIRDAIAAAANQTEEVTP